jgi:hypothetical protein
MHDAIVNTAALRRENLTTSLVNIMEIYFQLRRLHRALAAKAEAT